LWVERLELVDFRSYRAGTLDLTPGVHVLVGPNGRGKTNVLEALHRVAVGASHRIAGDTALVRDGASDAVVRVGVRTDDDRRRSIDVQLGAGRTRAQVDGQAVRRAADALGVLRVVAFAPEDLALVRGDPADRRRYLDQLLSQRRPSYAAALADYERVLRQRNTLLKDLRGGGGDGATLASWTDQLVAHGAPLVAARLAAVDALADPVATAHAALTGSDVPVGLTYRSDADVTSADDVTTIAKALHAHWMRRPVRNGGAASPSSARTVTSSSSPSTGCPPAPPPRRGRRGRSRSRARSAPHRCSPASVTGRCCSSTTCSASSTRPAAAGSPPCATRSTRSSSPPPSTRTCR